MRTTRQRDNARAKQEPALLTFIKSNEKTYVEFIQRYLLLNPDFEDGSIMFNIVGELLQTIHTDHHEPSEYERKRFITIFQQFRDMAIHSRMRFFNDTLTKQLKSLLDIGTIPRTSIDTYNAQLYVCTAYTSQPDTREKNVNSFISVGFYALWKTVEFFKRYVNQSEGGTYMYPTSVEAYLKLVDEDYTPPAKSRFTTGMQVEYNLHSNIQSPLLLNLYDSMKQKVSGMSASIQEYVKRIFYMQLMTSMPLMGDRKLQRVYFDTSYDTMDIPPIVPGQVALQDTGVESDMANWMVQRLNGICPGMKDANLLTSGNWFASCRNLHRVFEERNSHLIYTILRTKSVHVSLLRDSVCKGIQEQLLYPWGYLMKQTEQGKAKETQYKKVAVHSIIREILTTIHEKEGITEDEIRQAYVQVCALFQWALVSTYLYKSLYRYNNCFTIQDKQKLLEELDTIRFKDMKSMDVSIARLQNRTRVGLDDTSATRIRQIQELEKKRELYSISHPAVSTEAVYTRLEKPYVDVLLKGNTKMDIRNHSMYDNSLLLETNVNGYIYWAESPQQRRMDSMGIQVQSKEGLCAHDIQIHLELQNTEVKTLKDFIENDREKGNIIYNLLYPQELNESVEVVKSVYRNYTQHGSDITKVLGRAFNGPMGYMSIYRDTFPELPFETESFSLEKLLYLAHKANSQVHLMLTNGIGTLPICEATIDMVGGGRETNVDSRDGVTRVIKRVLYKEAFKETDDAKRNEMFQFALLRFLEKTNGPIANIDTFVPDTFLIRNENTLVVEDTPLGDMDWNNILQKGSKEERDALKSIISVHMNMIVNTLYVALKSKYIPDTLRDMKKIGRLATHIRPVFNAI